MKCCNTEMQTEGADRYRCDVCGVRPRHSAMQKRYQKALTQTDGDHKRAAYLLNIDVREFSSNLNELNLDLFHRKVKAVKRYIITAAQCNTPVFDKFLNTLELYAAENQAELIIIPLRYKNPTSVWSNEAPWWDRRVIPYLCDSRVELCKNLIVMADIKTVPTATDPLSGFEELSGKRSAIYGHTSLALRTVPVSAGEMAKIIATTGAVTKRNYTDSKAGKKGEFHHVHSAQAVEISDDVFHIRQLNATSDGSFIDLEWEYRQDGIYEAGPCGLVLGDWHDHAHSGMVLSATFTAKKSLVKRLKPELLVWHDVFDHYRRNHHHRGRPFINLAKHRGGCTNVREELEIMFKRVSELAGGIKSVFPFSNHPAALSRWIEEADWKTDPENAEFYLETALAMVRSTEMRGHKSHTVDAFAHWGSILFPQGIYLGPNDGYDYRGIKVDMHGHIGANGAKGGTVKAFAKLADKTVTGHGHGAGIHHSAYRVGTSSVYDQEYVAGPSSWLNTHCIIYANGKRSLINIINGEYTI